MTRSKLISMFFIGLLIFIVLQVFMIFSPFAKVIFGAAILTFCFYPLFVKFKRLLKKHDTLAAVLMTVFIFLVVIPPVIGVIVSLTGQVIELGQSVSDYILKGELSRLIDSVRSTSLIQGIETRIGAWEPLKQNIAQWVLGSVRSLGNFMTAQAGVITRNVLLFMVNMLFTFFLVFVFLRDSEKIYSFFYQLAPLEERNKKAIFNEINGTFSAVIRGQLLTSLVQSILLGIVFAVLGLPLPIFFAGVTFIASLIPVVGASSVWIPFVIYLAAVHEYGRALALLLLGAFLISFIDNLLKPALIGEKTKLPYFLLFFGILGGLKLYGFLGIFLAPAVLSLFFALAKIFKEEYLLR
ncbi:MAG TPA: AI-2E family transporter [Candidatus Omnitrophota bacterium]|nr:AI-2E family transporter [Candidatus Omnitrophota bacterium]